MARSDTGLDANPVPRGLATRREGGRKVPTVPLVKVPHTQPKVLAPAEADKLISALGTHCDRAMATAMVLVGLRRCKVLGLRLSDIWVGERRISSQKAREATKGSSQPRGVSSLLLAITSMGSGRNR